MVKENVNYKPRKWYNKYLFPLIPTLEIRKADKNNTWNFTFKWLIFTIWTIDSPSFELSVVADTHWGIGIVGLLPFFRWIIAIPCPEKLGMWINKHFSRAKHFYN